MQTGSWNIVYTMQNAISVSAPLSYFLFQKNNSCLFLTGSHLYLQKCPSRGQLLKNFNFFPRCCTFKRSVSLFTPTCLEVLHNTSWWTTLGTSEEASVWEHGCWWGVTNVRLWGRWPRGAGHRRVSLSKRSLASLILAARYGEPPAHKGKTF